MYYLLDLRKVSSSKPREGIVNCKGVRLIILEHKL